LKSGIGGGRQMKYRKTELIEAERFDGSYKMRRKYGIRKYIPVFKAGRIDTFQGEVDVHIGDWIATSSDGEHWPIADDIFKKTYAKLPVISRVWADTIEEYKASHYRLSEIFTEWDLGYGGQEVIARAWLDGYQVEEDKSGELKSGGK